MDVVLALEGVRVPLLVFDALHLNSRVEKTVLSPAEVGDSCEGLQRLHRLYVASHRNFAHGNAPDVQVVQAHNVSFADVLDIGLELVNVDFLGSALHHDFDDAPDNGHGCAENDDREQVGAKRVCDPHAGEEVNDGGSDDDTDTHKHVAHDVKEGRVDIDVAVRVAMVVAMGVAVVVSVVVVVVVMVLSLVSLLVLQKVLLDLFVLDLLFGVVVRVTVGVSMGVSVGVSVVMAVLVGMAVAVTVAMVVIVVVLATQMVVSVT